jgi:hypothetical protein
MVHQPINDLLPLALISIALIAHDRKDPELSQQLHIFVDSQQIVII